MHLTKPKKTTVNSVDAMTPDWYQIDTVKKDTEDTFTIELIPQDAEKKFSFEPGQFNMLYVYGIGEIPISISSDPSKPNRIGHTTRVVGTVTKGLRRLNQGELIGLRGPFGSSWPVKLAEGNDIVLVAGGIGLAPLRPVIYHVLNNRKKYGQFDIVYGARSSTDILFAKELEQWGARFDVNVLVTVDRSDNNWHGHVGVVTKLISYAPFDPMHTVAMTCGPEIMMRYTAIALQKRGIDNERIYVSMERNMKCAIGLCGHCQYAGKFICKDGPVFSYNEVNNLINKREL